MIEPPASTVSGTRRKSARFSPSKRAALPIFSHPTVHAHAIRFGNANFVRLPASGVRYVGCSQKGYHFGRPVITTLLESISLAQTPFTLCRGRLGQRECAVPMSPVVPSWLAEWYPSRLLPTNSEADDWTP